MMKNKTFYNYNHGAVGRGIKTYTQEEAARALYFLVPLDHTYIKRTYSGDDCFEEEVTTSHDWVECIFEDDVLDNAATFDMYNKEIAARGYYQDDAFVIYRNN